jgi:hypothetical protein
MEEDLPKIKTFKADVAEAVKNENLTMVKAAIAESRKREKTNALDKESSPTSKKNLFLIGGSILLVVIGLAVFGFFYFSKKPPQQTAGPTVIKPDIIFADSTKKVNLTTLDQKSIFTIIGNEESVQIPLGSIERLSFFTGTLDNPTILGSQDFINKLQTRIPPTLLRAFDTDFFFGLFSFDVNQPVLIFTTQDYQDAYAGMLDWEKNMQADIGGLFAPSLDPNGKYTFIDKVIENKDARVLVDASSTPIFFYTFVDNNTIVMTTSNSALQEVIARLTKPKLIH